MDKGGNMTHTWDKELTDSDAQQVTRGARMTFLRFTKGDHPIDHTTWFRDVFFADAEWQDSTSNLGHPTEKAKVNIHVVILGQDLGTCLMYIDHDPLRAENHNAPTTHLHYDDATRRALESQNLTGHTITVECADGAYSLTVE